jgi:hypothetical protein
MDVAFPFISFYAWTVCLDAQLWIETTFTVSNKFTYNYVRLNI